MRNYEVTIIVDPVLSGDEVKSTVEAYIDLIKQHDCEIVHKGEMGLRQLAYSIKKKHSGFYFCIEFRGESPALIDKMELSLKRDERILRFLTVSLDKFGVKFNEDRRNGLIGKAKKVKDEAPKETPVAVKEAPKVIIPDLPEELLLEEE